MGAAHRAYRILAGLFVVGALVQFFLAGLGVFQSETIFDAHGTFGMVLGLVALLLLILAIVLVTIGQLDRQSASLAALLFVLMVIQYLLVALFSEAAPALAALHPVNGLLMLGVAVLVASGRQIKARVRRT